MAKKIANVRKNYDREALTERVLESQRRRKFLKNVMSDQLLSWDYQPKENAAETYIRNTMPIYELEKRARFPKA